MLHFVDSDNDNIVAMTIVTVIITILLNFYSAYIWDKTKYNSRVSEDCHHVNKWLYKGCRLIITIKLLH